MRAGIEGLTQARIREGAPPEPGAGLEDEDAATCALNLGGRGEAGRAGPDHHHIEQQIAIVLSGELTFTVGGETRVMHAGECVVIPPHVEHGGFAGPEGCEALDVFTPPRAGIVRLMST